MIKVTEPQVQIPLNTEAVHVLGRGMAEIVDTVPSTRVLHPVYSSHIEKLAFQVAKANHSITKADVEILTEDIYKHLRSVIKSNRTAK